MRDDLDVVVVVVVINFRNAEDGYCRVGNGLRFGFGSIPKFQKVFAIGANRSVFKNVSIKIVLWIKQKIKSFLTNR